MEQDPLKSAWQNITTSQKSDAELGAMIKDRMHPILKRIRKQLVLEMLSFTALLTVYYDFFDGDQKPFYANVCLVAALALIILHNIMGYVFTKRPFDADNIKESLQEQLSKIKAFSIAAIACRLLAVVCLLVFFMSTITFNPTKYWLLTGVIIMLLVQLAILSSIWINRIKQIKTTISLFP